MEQHLEGIAQVECNEICAVITVAGGLQAPRAVMASQCYLVELAGI